jgi:hypothetical protein
MFQSGWQLPQNNCVPDDSQIRVSAHIGRSKADTVEILWKLGPLGVLRGRVCTRDGALMPRA